MMHKILKSSLLVLLFNAVNLQIVCADNKETKANAKKEEPAIPLTEDLMREHGLLNRVLLIYEELIRRIDADDQLPMGPFKQAVDIIKSFVEDYHEKMEEDYVFPIFEKKKKETKLVSTLRTQHIKGREVTAQLQALAASKEPLNQKSKKMVRNLLQKFITMYRPHEAREDTELFPLVRSLISEKEFKELGEKTDELEHKLFGKNGFEMMLKKVEGIEKELGIYKLEQFTPGNLK